MSATPPTFQESDRCDVCKCSFNAFRRRHHCRCCGRTLCNGHSSNYMALPQFGLYTDVRVCYDCFNKSSSTEKGDEQTSADVADSFSRLGVEESTTSVSKASSSDSNVVVPDCKCGMPLCICEAPTPEPAPLQNTNAVNTTSNPKPKKPTSSQQAVKKPASSSTTKSSAFLNSGQLSYNNTDMGQINYDISGEGLREAIKNSDATAVKELLSKGVDANYCDKQGFTLLHLAALFNQTEIAFILIDHGASSESKNAQGETPIDCAPTMLQFKMRSKIEELAGIANRD